jgi:hypothetical protein
LYTIIKKIRAVLVPAERLALNRHILLGVLISVLDILFLAMIVWLINITASHQQVVIANYGVSGFIWNNLIAVAIGTVLLFGIKNSVQIQLPRGCTTVEHQTNAIPA